MFSDVKNFLFGSWNIFKRPWHLVLLIILGAAISFILSFLVSLANIDNILGSYETAQESLIGSGGIFTWLKICVLAPVTEELIFRGLIFGLLIWLTKKILKIKEQGGAARILPAAIISSAIFGIVHLNLAQGVYAFLYGLILCIVFESYQNILSPIFMHAAANALSLTLYFLH